MTVDDEHSILRLAWARVGGRLRDLRQNLDFGDDTFHVEFADKANRAADLTLYLDAAVRLGDDHLYGPGFAVLRSGLEHAVLDWLVFLGRTYVQQISGVSEETWADWQADRAAGANWTTGITTWTRTRKGDVTIRRDGLYTQADEEGNRDQLSIYYFLLQEYDGLMGKPADQEDDGFLTPSELRARASENEERWILYLRWSALVENLVENHLIEEEDRGRLAVHYRFLSTFAHPVSESDIRLYARPLDGAPPHYDHYASELILLYVVALGELELSNYAAGVAASFGAEVARDHSYDDERSDARKAADHFWFIGWNPHAWDFHQAANMAQIDRLRKETSATLTAATGASPAFPLDPLSRLVRQHSSARGRVAGAEYASPWPRRDATGVR